MDVKDCNTRKFKLDDYLFSYTNRDYFRYLNCIKEIINLAPFSGQLPVN